MEYDEFRAKTLKLHGDRHFKITNSYGTKQAWRWIKKNKWLDIGMPLTERTFGAIVKAVNSLLACRLLEGHDVVLPHRMGILELRKYASKIEFKNGKLVTNLPIDWKKTLQLWHSDSEAYENKTVVRSEAKEIFRIRYNKKFASYKNKSFYQFSANRNVRKALSEKIKDNEIDAFLYEIH